MALWQLELFDEILHAYVCCLLFAIPPMAVFLRLGYLYDDKEAFKVAERAFVSGIFYAGAVLVIEIFVFGDKVSLDTAHGVALPWAALWGNILDDDQKVGIFFVAVALAVWYKLGLAAYCVIFTIYTILILYVFERLPPRGASKDNDPKDGKSKKGGNLKDGELEKGDDNPKDGEFKEGDLPSGRPPPMLAHTLIVIVIGLRPMGCTAGVKVIGGASVS